MVGKKLRVAQFLYELTCKYECFAMEINIKVENLGRNIR